MKIILVTGGARSGKSSYAQDLATRVGGNSVTVIATAVPGDDDMRQRIARHRIDRPAAWPVVECPTRVPAAIAASTTDVVLLDCLTMLAANQLESSSAHSADAVNTAVMEEVKAVVDSARTRAGTIIVVTNEVGSSIHPETELGRWFQEALGRANQMVAREAAAVSLLICGIPVPVKGDVEAAAA